MGVWDYMPIYLAWALPLASIISDKHPGEPGLLVTGGEEVKHKEWINHVKVGIEISICTQCYQS